MIEQYTSPAVVNNSQEPWLVGEGVSLSGSIAIPSLDFNFVTNAFPGTATFSRASSATLFDSSGTLQSVGNNVPRLDYDPATLAARGLLIEEQRTNLFTNSNDFANAWNVVGTSLTVTADTATSPDGTANADSVIESAATEIHYALKDFTITGNATYSLSVFVKNLSGTRLLGLRISNTAWTNRIAAVFDPSTGTWSSAPSATGTATSPTGSIQDVGNGWYRVTITGVPDPAVNTVRATIAISNNSASSLPSYAGNGTSGFYLWGAQLEAGAFPTSYIPTTTTALTRSADVASVNTLSPWFNATEGTLFAEAFWFGLTANDYYAALNDGTSSNLIGIGVGSTGSWRFLVTNVGNIEANISSGVVTANTVFKHSGAYKVNDFAASVKRGSVGTDTSGVVPSGITTLSLTASHLTTNQFNGYLRRIVYYPRRLANAELQSITS